MSTGGDPETISDSGGKQDLSDLQENLNRQQAKISALKELVRQSDAAHGKSKSSAQEKVKNIAQRLSHIKSKARSRQNLDSSLGELQDEPILEETPMSSPVPSRARSETPGSEKIQLLRRQVEENKTKMAERMHSKREIEERVTQLKAKMDSTQQTLERSSELGRSMGDLSVLSPGTTKDKFKSASDLSFTPLNLDKEKIKFLENRIKLLEKQIEKQATATPATESEAVATLKNRILDLEENLREKECIIEARTQAVSLMSESLSAKTATTVDTLEDTRIEMQKMQQNFIQSESDMQEEIRALHEQLEEKDQKIRNMEEVNDILETARFELTVKNAELEGKLQDVQEYSTKLDELNKHNEALQLKISSLEDQLTEKTVEYNVLNANFSVLQEKLKATAPKSLFSKTGDEEAELEIKKMKDQLDEANKGMIKIKLKAKQLQKQVDSFKKMSDAHGEVNRLTDENQQLQLKIAELEEEKGSLQLKMLSGGSEKGLSEDSEIEKKLQVLETTCQNQTSAIQLLEEQKLELQTTNQELESFKEQAQASTRNEKTVDIASQIESIQLEEQNESFVTQANQLQADLERVEKENETLRESIHTLVEDKQELQKKVDCYIAENIELLDKVEKLSKSSSSAESIEIVERLTHQEKLEMEEFNKKLSTRTEDHDDDMAHPKEKADDNADVVMGPELSDSLVKLREESSDLMHRIELFTKERREVLGKMEILTSENQDLSKQITELKEENAALEDNLTKTKLEIVTLEDKLDAAMVEKADIEKTARESIDLKAKLQEELNKLSAAKGAAKATTSADIVASPQLKEQCIDSLAQLNNELDNYRKSNDKSSRLNASKKLAKEVKNACQQFGELLDNLQVADSVECKAYGQLEADIELKQKLSELEALTSQLKAELEQSKNSSEEKDLEILQLNKKINTTQGEINEIREQRDLDLDKLNQIRKELEGRLGAADSEIDILKTLVAEQKQQLIDAFTEHELELNTKADAIQNYEAQIEQLQVEFGTLRSESAKSNDNFVCQLKEEIKKLQNMLSNNEKLIAEHSSDMKNKQDTIESLNAQIMDLYKTMEENTNKIIEKDDEIAYLQDLFDSNKSENQALVNENEENKKVSEKLLVELHANQSNIEKMEMLNEMEQANKSLETRVKLLETTNASLEVKNKEQVDKLKKFAANLKKKTAQYAELELKLKEMASSKTSCEVPAPDHENVIQALESELQKLRQQIHMMQASNVPKIELEAIENELAALRRERDAIVDKYSAVSRESEGLKMEISQYKSKVEYFERNINEVHALVDILHKDTNVKEDEIRRIRGEFEASQGELWQHQEKLNTVNEELKNKTLKFEKSKSVIKEKNREIQRLSGEIEGLKQQISTPPAEPNREQSEEFAKLREEYDRLVSTSNSERDSFQQTISRLETLYDGIQAKFQENMSYIESIETENNSYKEKNVRLENCIASFEERRQSMERQTNLLDAELQERANEYERNEDALIYRLNMLLDHDDCIGKRLIEAQEEKEDMSSKLEQLRLEHSELQMTLSQTTKELEAFKSERVSELTSQIESLREQLENTRQDLSRQQNIYEGRLAQKHAEIDEMENDLSVQLNNINQEKRKVQESLEKSQDEINDLKDENVRLKESANSLEQTRTDLERELTWLRMQNENMNQDQYDLQELRMQSIQDKSEIENLKHQMDTLIQSHEIELNGLREQMNELDSVRMQVGQNQTDDQVFIETENKRLKEQLAEKESAIENYQRENLKLQMASMLGGPSLPSDPFSSAGAHAVESAPQESFSADFSLRERIKALEDEVTRVHNLLTEKDQMCHATTMEAQATKEQHIKLQQETSNLRAELQSLRQTHFNTQELPAALNPFFAATTSDASSVFDELVSAHHVTPLQQQQPVGGQPDQKKIEDLERNVSDLEKYTNELENKLKNLTSVHENTLLQLQDHIRRYDEAVKQNEERIHHYEERIKQYEDKVKELEIQRNVESMIVTENATVETLPSLNMFFTKASQQPSVEFDRLIQAPQVDTTDHASPLPVEEEVIVAKKAYILHPEPTELSTVLETEEGWGWGSEEAALEERHQTELLQAKSHDQTQLSELKMRIDELELERNRSDEKVIELQVKCGKLMKKLKEYKSRLDQAESEKAFRKSASIESSDLDLAIQEELKTQLKTLEEKNAEMKKQYGKEHAEKDNLIKRVDVLTSANDRMTEMKERQDIEVEGLQMKVRQLSQQLKQLEDWGDREGVPTKSESEPTPASSDQQQADMENKLKIALKELEDSRVDRDELQALLDDEKDNALINEKKISDLKAKIETLEEIATSSVAETQNTTTELEQTLQKQRETLAEKEAELRNAVQMTQNFQFQLNDYQATIGQLSSESDSIKSHLGTLQSEYSEKVNENAQLSEDVKVWMEKCEQFSREIEALKVKSDATIESAETNDALEEKIQDLTSQVQYKEAEILHLKQKIQDQMQEDQTQHLVQEILGKNQEIVQLRIQVQQLESDKVELENNLSKQITEEMAQRTVRSAEDMEATVQTLEKELDDMRQEKQQMETELQVLNNHVMTSLGNEDKMKETILELDTKNFEITELRSTLEALKQQKQQPPQQPSQTEHEVDHEARIAEVNKSWEQTVELKCAEIAESWRQYMEQRENEFKQTESSLNLEIEQLRAGIPVMRRKISDDVESEKAVEAVDAEIVEKMQTALEQQELEIVTLKEQLAMRSAEYARLAARHDPYAMSTTSSNISFESKSQRKLSTSSSGTTAGGDQAGIISKSELDLAMYMLHQRDMRCEELTLELVNLLEERDTLQLKLSNSLRQIEEIKQKASYPESGWESDQVSSNPNSPDKLSRAKLSIGAENESQSDNLSSKLSQLQSKGYTKDKGIREEREQRLRQMEKIQQDVANIPSEAVSELVGTDITNAIQSPSNVLLDWLWGKNNSQQS